VICQSLDCGPCWQILGSTTMLTVGMDLENVVNRRER
jgi:hypothetical protein